MAGKPEMPVKLTDAVLPGVYSNTFGESSDPRIFVATPGMLAPTSGRLLPPLALYQANNVRSA